MATNILFTVLPEQGVPGILDGKVLAEASYLQNSTDDDGTALPLPQSVRLELDAGLRGSAQLEGAASLQVQASVLAADGSALLSRAITADARGNAVMTLLAAEVELIRQGGQQLPADTTPLSVTRTARLVPTGSGGGDFARSHVVVVPVADAAALAANGVGALLKSDGARTSTLEATGLDLSPLSSLAWMPAHLAVDGTFNATFTRAAGLGWIWWLIGRRQVLGFLRDDLARADTRTFMIPLPPSPGPAGGDSAANAEECECEQGVSADVTEAEVANNPGVYTEDPGAFCKPFSNPERVLSEKAFAVIARVTQPEIGPMGSVKGRTMTLLNLDEGARARTGGSGVSGLLRAFGARAPVALGELVPSRHALVGRYIDLLRRLPSGRGNMDASHPLQWEDDIAQYQAATPAIGHILEFRVRWRSNGYSLGTVAKTLTLAPRQTKRIQKIEWERSDRARRAERTQLRDQENDSTVRERDYHDQVAAHLSEWASGRSSSDTEAIAGGIGFFASGILGGIGGGAASAHSSSHQEGGRDTTASEEQRLRDSIRRHGDALRKFESTVVNEVTQEETVTGTTEVIRNANYTHSLTVIYYQILRHLKVTTEFAGVRECIFVPFAIKPFDVLRAYRWRESLQASIRSPLYSRALRYLKDVATDFATSDIAPGPRAGQPLVYVRGSLYVSLAVERPRDAAGGLFDAASWAVAQPLLLTPAQGIFSMLMARGAAERERSFQAEHAPGMAALWANRILLRTSGGRVLHADCTLASRYQFNQSVRIDFAIPAGELAGLSRQELQQLTLLPGNNLPPGSVANLTRISLVYTTQRYEHAVEGRTGTNDLVNPVTGTRDPATVVLPLDSWETVDERLEIRRSVDQLVEHLNEHVEYYHKAIWWRMDRDRLLMLLDGFYVPNTNRVSIASVVDREPVGVIGNAVVYRVGAASFLGYGKVTTPAELHNVYARKEPTSDPVLISLPTDGLYAQTIMDECLALEEHFGNLDWVLNDKEPELGAIDPSLLQSRAVDQTPATTPTAFPGTLINLQNAPEAAAPSGLQGALNAVTTSNAFRDMAGLAATQANAVAALNTAAGLATNFGNQAAALQLAKMARADQATRTADQKLASIKNAKDKGLTDEAGAAAQAKEVLAAMNPDSSSAEAPHQNPAISSAILAAKAVPGSTVEANTAEGGVKVTLGEARTQLASLAQPLQEHCAFWDFNAVPVGEDSLRDAVRQAAEDERDLWLDAAGNVIKETVNSQYGHLVRYWLGRFSDIPPLALAALQAKAVDGSVSYGPLHVAGAAAATVATEVTRVRGELMTAVTTPVPATVRGRVEAAVRHARESGVITPANTRLAWSAIFVVSVVRKAAIQLGLEAEVGGVHRGKDVLLLGHEGHRVYVAEAFARRAAGTKGTYHSFRTTERAVEVGDIIAQDRQATTIGGVWRYEDIPTLVAAGREMHGDVVIEVPAGGDHVVAIGGNVGNSTRKRRYPVNTDGRLVVAREQLYTTEDDAGLLDPIPPPSAAAGLNTVSTGRIFALLGLVPLCVTIPGQPVKDDTFLV
jgi:hypothetical protein